MASSDLPRGEVRADKIVIVTGPTVKAAMSFLLIGAAIGATATLYLTRVAAPPDGQSEAGGHGSTPEQFAGRLFNLTKRMKSLASRTRTTLQSASEVLGPAVSDALAEAREAARQTEVELEAEINQTTPAVPLPAPQP